MTTSIHFEINLIEKVDRQMRVGKESSITKQNKKIDRN
jgi:hypothetical protein